MKAINNLDDLIEALPDCSGSDYVRIAKNMSIPRTDFLPYQNFDKSHYTRNCISRTDDYELLLLCWEPGQETPIHCHFGEECWVYNVKGNILEERFELEGEELITVDKSMFLPKSLSYMNDEMGYHLLKNVSGERAMTLHLYMNPIDRCTVYDDQKEDFVLKELEYDTMATHALEAAY